MTDLKPPEDRDELLVAVLALVTEVKGLNEKLNHYAPRDEVRSTFRRGAWKFFALAAVVIFISQSLTMTTISYCFLNAKGEARAACSAMPGYGEATRQNDVRLARFDLLLSGIEQTNVAAEENDRRMAILETRIAELEKKEGGK